MATTASGFWYPDEGTNFNINTIMSTAMSSVETKAGPHVLDTGWVDCVRASGIRQQGGADPQVRRIGKVVYMRWGVSANGIAGNSVRTVFTIPVGYRPPVWKYFPVASSSAGFTALSVVKNDGGVEIRTNASAGSYYMWDVVSYAID